MYGGLTRIPALVLPILAATFLVGCELGNPTGPRVASLILVSGDGQAATVGATVPDPLVVRTVDQDGVAVPNLQVAWTVVSGGGSFVAASFSTDAQGYGQAIYRLGNVLGAQTVSARVGTQPAVTFTLLATPAPASQMRANSGNAQTGAAGAVLGAPLVVFVSDALDNPKSGIAVTFTVASGGGSVSSTTAFTNANGLASVTWTLGPDVGAQVVVASSPGLPQVSFTATANAP